LLARSRGDHQRGCRQPESEPGDDLSSARPRRSGEEAQHCVSPIARHREQEERCVSHPHTLRLVAPRREGDRAARPSRLKAGADRGIMCSGRGCDGAGR
jgi:hypothetical protein